MADREKVIKGLECCRKVTNSCEGCPYESVLSVEKCMFVMHDDAFALLKEQEAELLQQEAELDILRNIYKQENSNKQMVKWE